MQLSSEQQESIDKQRHVDPAARVQIPLTSEQQAELQRAIEIEQQSRPANTVAVRELLRQLSDTTRH